MGILTGQIEKHSTYRCADGKIIEFRGSTHVFYYPGTETWSGAILYSKDELHGETDLIEKIS